VEPLSDLAPRDRDRGGVGSHANNVPTTGSDILTQGRTPVASSPMPSRSAWPTKSGRPSYDGEQATIVLTDGPGRVSKQTMAEGMMRAWLVTPVALAVVRVPLPRCRCGRR
jgi:hypothetical protein